jgi:hypothetical protein
VHCVAGFFIGFVFGFIYLDETVGNPKGGVFAFEGCEECEQERLGDCSEDCLKLYLLRTIKIDF